MRGTLDNSSIYNICGNQTDSSILGIVTLACWVWGVHEGAHLRLIAAALISSHRLRDIENPIVPMQYTVSRMLSHLHIRFCYHTSVEPPSSL